MARTIEETQARIQEIQIEMRDINAVVEARGGDFVFNEDEDRRFKALENELKLCKRSLQAAAASGDENVRSIALRELAEFSQEYRLTTERAQAGDKFRELLDSGKKQEVSLFLRAGGTTLSTDVASAIPVTVGDLIQPLEKGMIMGKVGTKMLTGLSGDYKYPIFPYVEATIEGEAVKVDDTTLKLDALTPNPKRIALKIPMSNWALQQSGIVLYNALVNALSQGIMRFLNRWMFQPSAIATNVYGPMAYNASSNPIVQKTLSATPTYAELQEMMGEVESSGAYNDGTFAYVMSAKMAAKLRSTPKVAGGEQMIIDKGEIDGFPVFLTEEIEAVGDGTYNATPKHIGFGRFSDVMVAQFGNLRLVIDPYTLSDEDTTRFIVNAHFAEDVIRKGSFVIGTIA